MTAAHIDAFGRGAMAWVRQSITANMLLLSNAGAASVGTVATAGLGFVFWIVCARYLPAEAVGLAAAVISIMNLIGLIGELSLGTLLIGESLRHREKGPALISASLIVALVSSLIFAIVFTGLWSAFASQHTGVVTSLTGAAVFIAGAGITGFAMALDQCFIGMLRGSLLMYRGITTSVLKLVILIAGVLAFDADPVLLILSAWILGQLISIVLLATALKCQRQQIWHSPDFTLFRPLYRAVLGHHALNLVTQTPGLLMPFLVVSILSPSINAAFSVGWMVLNVTFLLPASLATVLYTIGVVHPESLAERMRFSLTVSALIGIGAGLTFLLFANTILGVFNPSYAAVGGDAMRLIGFSVLGVAVKYHFIALYRIRNAMMSAAMLLTIGGALELGFAIVGANAYGLSGLVLGWLLAVFLQAAAMLPGVLRAADVGERPLPWPGMGGLALRWRKP